MAFAMSFLNLILLASYPSAGQFIGVVLLSLYARRRGWW